MNARSAQTGHSSTSRLWKSTSEDQFGRKTVEDAAMFLI